MTDAEFQAFLDDISVCFITQNFDQWAGRITLPFTMVTQAGPIVAYSIDELRTNFEHSLMACQTMVLDTIFRTPISCAPCEDGSVIATYRTELLSHGQRMTDPFTSSATLKKIDGTWRVSAIIGAFGHRAWSGRQPHKPKMAHITNPPKNDAQIISDAIIESTRQAILARDFDAFALSFVLPHLITTFDASKLIKTRAEMRAIFTTNSHYYSRLGVTDIVRESVSSEFDGPDTIKAMHIAHLISGDKRVNDPVPCFAVLIKTDGVWRISKSDYAMGPDGGLTLAIHKLKRSTAPENHDPT